MPEQSTSPQQQASMLAARGLAVDAETPKLLLAEGYYPVVAAYEAFFIDKQASSAHAHTVFAEGTAFSDLFSLYTFDRALRGVVIASLLSAEARMKAVCTRTFEERFAQPDAYLDEDSYATCDEYLLGAHRRDDDLRELIRKLERLAYTDKRCSPCIEAYRERAQSVPMQALAGSLTFGTVAHLFNLLKRDVQSLVCRRVKALRGDTSKSYFSATQLRLALRTLVEFRNICAHDERLFCAKVGPVKQEGFHDMLCALRTVLPACDVATLEQHIANLACERFADSEKHFAILASCGVPIDALSPDTLA